MKLDRRTLMSISGWGAAAGVAGLVSRSTGAAEGQYARAIRGLPKLKITGVKAILLLTSSGDHFT